MRLASAVLLFTMMILTFVDVVGRYVFTAPVFGAAEMIQFLLAMTIFAGLGLVNAADDHISVDLFDRPLSRLLPRLRPFLIQLFSLAAMVIIAYQLIEFAIEAEQNNRITVVLEWPLAVVSFAIAGLSGLSLLAQVLGLLARSSARTRLIDGGPSGL
ncbi:MAG: TRAP transporter small permease [Pseudomonadota bacterium]